MPKFVFIIFYALLLSASSLYALEVDSAEADLEVVVVTGVGSSDSLELTASRVSPAGIDNSDLLRVFPGANRNANGPVTRISQYRGMFGAQNNVSIDGLSYTSGGPNWMDSPLSAIPQLLTESVTLYRGLGSVSTIKEGLGGGIAINSRKGGFSATDSWENYGKAQVGYGDNASSWGASVFTGVHNQKNWLDISASLDKGDDYEFNGGTVAATEYDRNQYRFSYGHRFSQTSLDVSAVINRTGKSGTPALPMDIIYFDSEQYSLGLESHLNEGDLVLKISQLSVDHIMDNFTLRPTPKGMNGMKVTRETYAVGDTGSLNLAYHRSIGEYELVFGVDGIQEEHDADISNPMNAMFHIINFNEAERDRLGFFAQSTMNWGYWDIEAGLRYNRVEMDAGEVGGNIAMMGGNMMPPTQQDRLDVLANAFNEADRNKKDNLWSGILKASLNLSDNTRLNLGLGRKSRSPSYQERYLWLPMEATAGLADGYTYIGAIDLKPESSVEVTAGVDWSAGRFKLTPEAYYRDVKNYIQGTPSTNMIANMFAMMMSGRLPFQFTNVDAKIYGLDLGYEFAINDAWMIRGNLTYVRGKRTDIKDNLYRIAPLSSFLELLYQGENYFVSLESIAASKQDNVSSYNNEKTTAGGGIVNMRTGVTLGSYFGLDVGVENFLDKAYQDHLGGYNRVIGSAVPLRERLYSKGRNYYIRLNANW